MTSSRLPWSRQVRLATWPARACAATLSTARPAVVLGLETRWKQTGWLAHKPIVAEGAKNKNPPIGL